MDLTLSPNEQAFRDEVRGWLAENHPGERAARRRRQLRVPQAVAAQAPRAGLRRPVVAGGVRRPRRHADRAGDLRRGAGAGQGARPRQRARPGHGRPRGDRPRHRGAEAALPRADPLRRGDLVPGLLRARVRLGPRVAEDQGGQGRRRVGGDRPEGVDHARPRGQVVHARRAHRPRRPQAQGAHLLPDGHGAGRGPGAPAAPDHRRGRVQRAVHRGGADPRRERGRRRGQRLGRGHHHADARARRPGRRRRGHA